MLPPTGNTVESEDTGSAAVSSFNRSSTPVTKEQEHQTGQESTDSRAVGGADENASKTKKPKRQQAQASKEKTEAESQSGGDNGLSGKRRARSRGQAAETATGKSRRQK